MIGKGNLGAGQKPPVLWGRVLGWPSREGTMDVGSPLQHSIILSEADGSMLRLSGPTLPPRPQDSVPISRKLHLTK